MWGRVLLAFGAASLAAVAVGAVVCAMSGVPAALWLRNLAGWAVGAGAAAGLAAVFRPLLLPAVLWAAPLGLAATFLGPGQLGVYRWLDFGPLSMNAAMLLLPSAVVALAVLAKGRPWTWIPAFAALLVLAAQPDASQATALAAAMAAIALTAVGRPWIRVAIATAAAAVTAVAWLRPDPLQPVPEVEGIVGLAMDHSPMLAGLLMFALLAAAGAPLLASSGQGAGSPARALGLCLLTWSIAPFLGAYPVPLAGVGLSPILGAWFGVGLLAGLHGISTTTGPGVDTAGRG